MERKIYNSIKKFKLDLTGYNILTEAASGNYACTPIIAAVSGAKKVYAIVKKSKYATKKEVIRQVETLSKKMNVSKKICIIEKYSEVDLGEINILTNTGFNRPINKKIISQLNAEKCVIPLMWEPWEFRDTDIDIRECKKKGVKVYGTNESDKRLLTMDYIGYIVLYWLLNLKCSPMSSKLLLLGSGQFLRSTEKVLKDNNYKYDKISTYKRNVNVGEYDCIVCLEHKNKLLLISSDGKGFIDSNKIPEYVRIIHISGNIKLKGFKGNCIPRKPAMFGSMSFTTDFIDSMAVIDLHTAGLNVAEGMLKANRIKLTGIMYKEYMEKNYPALAFSDKRYW